MRTSGYISPAKAARLLGVHYCTVYRYCCDAVAGRPSKLQHVKQNRLTRYYSISLAEVLELRRNI